MVVDVELHMTTTAPHFIINYALQLLLPHHLPPDTMFPITVCKFLSFCITAMFPRRLQVRIIRANTGVYPAIYLFSPRFPFRPWTRRSQLCPPPSTSSFALLSDGRETPSLCCQNGKVRLWPLPASPGPVLLNLLWGDTPQSRSFLANIRRVNSAFSFTSTGSGFGIPLSQVRFAAGPPTFVIQRAFHHYVNSPLPQVGSSRGMPKSISTARKRISSAIDSTTSSS